MNKSYIWLGIWLLGCIPIPSAPEYLKNPEDVLKRRSDQQLFEDAYILSIARSKEAVRTGNETINNLRANLEHIIRLENDPPYRDCVFLSESIKQLTSMEIRAKEMRRQENMTESEYQSFIKDSESEMKRFKGSLESKKCHKEYSK